MCKLWRWVDCFKLYWQLERNNKREVLSPGSRHREKPGEFYEWWNNLVSSTTVDLTQSSKLKSLIIPIIKFKSLLHTQSHYYHSIGKLVNRLITRKILNIGAGKCGRIQMAQCPPNSQTSESSLWEETALPSKSKKACFAFA